MNLLRGPLPVILASALIPSIAHAQGLGLPGPGGCYEDGLEPNTYATPTPLDRTLTLDLNICAGDDWFRLELRAGQVASMELALVHAQGDIDMTLHDADFGRIDISESASNREFLRYVATEDTTLALRVYGYGGAANTYTLNYTLDDYSRACPDAGHAGSLPLGEMQAGRLCLGRTAEWTLEADEDEPFEVTLRSDPALGDLDLAAFDEEGIRVASSASIGRWERMRVFPDGSGSIRLVVSGREPGFGPFSLAAIPLSVREEPLSIEGALRYSRPVPSPLGLKDSRDVQPAGILVEIVRLSDQHAVARTVTGPEGAFRFSLPYGEPADHILRVSAMLEDPSYRLRVIPRQDLDEPLHLDSRPLDEYTWSGNRLMLEVDVPRAHRMAGALNIATTSRAALEAISDQGLRAPLDVTFVWSPGQAHACGSCYGDGTILLAGGPVDTDEFDDAVILHELSHYIIDALSADDSPGGRHDGTPTTPLIAYGEGIATGLALVLLGDPFYVDTAGRRARAFEDMETIPYLDAYGTSDGSLRGDVSEWTTAGLVWDFVDEGTGAEPFDNIAIGAGGLLALLLGPMIDTRRPDRGIPGLDLADLVDALRCTDPDAAGGLLQLVRGHQQFPIDAWGKAKCQWSPVQ